MWGLWGWTKGEIYNRPLDTHHELLAGISDPAACINKRVYQLRRTKRDFRTLVAKCTEIGDGIFEQVLRTVAISV
jgi:hypothetical protein